MIQRCGVDSRGFQIDAELVQHFVGKLRDVPLIGMLLARAIGFHQRIGDGFGAFEHEFLLVAAFEERPAQRVDRLALLVHHVVVFEQVLAGFEVLRFDGLLRVLDALADQLAIRSARLPSFPARYIRAFTRSPPKMRSRSSSSDRKKRDEPGSPWRPARPRS